LNFTPPGDAWGTPYASFTFHVQDNSGVDGRVNFDPTPNTITFNVTRGMLV